MEPTVGLEPATGGLQNRCSAFELRRRRATDRVHISISLSAKMSSTMAR
jgi:hypothetical protein